MGRRRLLGSGALAIGLAVGIASAASSGVSKEARADGPDHLKRERCAIRLAGSLLGSSPSAELLGASDPQAVAASLLTAPATKSLFVERFARFVNAQLNDAPGTNAEQDAVYFTAYRVIDEDLTWDRSMPRMGSATSARTRGCAATKATRRPARSS